MREFLRHYYVGNDAPPWAVAALRAVLGAFIMGSLGFLSAWQVTDDLKSLISAGLTPALTYIGVRLGIEGMIDQWKNDKDNLP